MALTVAFIKHFLLSLFYASPLIVFLVLTIVVLGQRIGRKEGWSRGDALYFSFITATTVGYGDFRPTTSRSKLMAIAIAFVGLLLTGIVVGIGLNAAQQAFTQTVDFNDIKILEGFKS